MAVSLDAFRSAELITSSHILFQVCPLSSKLPLHFWTSCQVCYFVWFLIMMLLVLLVQQFIYGLHLLVVHWSSSFSFSFLCDLSLVVCNMSERIHICMSYSPILWTTLENAECKTYMYIFIIWNCSWDSSIDGNSTSSANITASFSKFVSQLKSMKQWTNSLLLDIMQLNLITKATLKTKERSHDKEEAVMGYSIVKSVFKPHGPSSWHLSWFSAPSWVGSQFITQLLLSNSLDFPDDLPLPIYTPGWRGTENNVSCPRTQHNDPARSQTQTSQPRRQLTNY